MGAQFFLYIYLTYIVMSRFVQPLGGKGGIGSMHLQHSKLGACKAVFMGELVLFFISIIIVIAK